MSTFEIKKLTPDLFKDYFDFFDNRAFSDGSPFAPCYCNAFNLSKERMKIELYQKAEEYGNDFESWKRVLRESAERMVVSGEIQGYLVFDKGMSVGWCNANERLSYYHTGEFDLHIPPEDQPAINCDGPGQVKAIVCFEIAPDYRGKGLASMLLQRVCEDARAEGFKYVEAYPVKDGGYMGQAFTGPMHMYEKAGFKVVSQNGESYIMRKTLG